MKRLLFLFVFTCFIFATKAQDTGFAKPANLGSPFISAISPVNFNLQTGLNVGSMGSHGNYFQSYLSPSLSAPVNKNLTITAGVTYSNIQLNHTPMVNTEGNVENFSGNLNTLTMFTAGSYRVNDKLTVTGSAFKTINPSFNARLNPNQLQMEAQGVSFGVGYQLSENTHIGAEIRMQQGNSNFLSPYSDPYNSPFNRGNFGNSPFMFGY